MCQMLRTTAIVSVILISACARAPSSDNPAWQNLTNAGMQIYQNSSQRPATSTVTCQYVGYTLLLQRRSPISDAGC